MTNKFALNHDKSNTVSTKIQRLVRLMQLKSPDVVIRQEIAALQRELADASEIVTVNVTVQTR